VAELADAPDLGFRNRRFQNVPFCFKKQSIYEGKMRFFAIRVAFATDEYKRRRSSTNSSTRTRQKLPTTISPADGFDMAPEFSAGATTKILANVRWIKSSTAKGGHSRCCSASTETRKGDVRETFRPAT